MITQHKSAQAWLEEADGELARAGEAWRGGNAGKGRVGSRRAAGMALKAWLTLGVGGEGYGTSFMHHLNALADDASQPAALREAGWRLAARKTPEGGFSAPTPATLTPMDDAALIMGWCRAATSS